MNRKQLFTRFAHAIADFAGRPLSFILAFGVVVVWAVSGPLFGFSDTWQLVINTGTTIVTFLMVFLIQNAQNRDTHALQIKLDELIRVSKGANTGLLDLEELDDTALCQIQKRYEKIAAQSRKHMDQTDDIPHLERPTPSKKRAVKRKPLQSRRKPTG